MSVVIKSPDEIVIMREAGRLNAEVRKLLLDAIAPGVTGRELDELAKAEIARLGATPTFVGYGPGGRPPYAGVEQAIAGKRIGDLSSAIGAVARREGYGIIREYGGHGVGRRMHEEPHIPNYGRPGVGHVLKPGMVLALEPMFSLGAEDTEEEADRWTVRMRDGSLCAHFEETIAVTDGAPEILTSMGRLDEAHQGAAAVPASGAA